MNPLFQQPTITVAAALHATSAVITEATRQGIAVSVSVVDPGMGLVAYAKADGAPAFSEQVSRRKANTAAAARQMTGWMPEGIAVVLPNATDNALTNLPGGSPLTFNGQLGGGVGVSGGTVEQDAALAQHALEALNADPA